MTGKEPSIFVTHGSACPIARFNMARVKKYLIANGYDVVEDVRDADTCILATCIAFEAQEQKTFRFAHKLQDENTEINVVMAGCGPKGSPETFEKYEGFPGYEGVETKFPPRGTPYSCVDLVGLKNFQPPRRVARDTCLEVLDILERTDPKLAEVFRNRETLNLTVRDETDYPVLISKGCRFNCSYCVIREAIKPYVSFSMEEIFSQVEEGFSQGYRNFTLLCNDAASYGVDLPGKPTLRDLFDGLFERFPEARFGIRYLSTTAAEKLLDGADLQLYGERLFRINMPIQSASERILKKMRRPRNLDHVKELMLKFREHYDGALTTEVMYGFPGETKEDVEETCRYVIEAGFDKVIAYQFSPRPGTIFEGAEVTEKAEDYRRMLYEVESRVTVRYFRRAVSSFSGEDFVEGGKAFRFQRGRMPGGLQEMLSGLDWEERDNETWTVFLHPDFPDLSVRVKDGGGRGAFQFRLRTEFGGWSQVSVDLAKAEEASGVAGWLDHVFNGRRVEVKKGGRVAELDGVRFSRERVEGFGETLEVVGPEGALERLLGPIEGLESKAHCPLPVEVLL